MGRRAGWLFVLSDSNYDWGQGLKELLEWRDAHRVDVVDVWYFGLDPRADVPPLRELPLADAGFVNGRPWEEIVRREMRGRKHHRALRDVPESHLIERARMVQRTKARGQDDDLFYL